MCIWRRLLLAFCLLYFSCRGSQRWLTSKLSDELPVQNKVMLNIPHRILASNPISVITDSTCQWHAGASQLACFLWEALQHWGYILYLKYVAKHSLGDSLYKYSILFNNLQNHLLSLFPSEKISPVLHIYLWNYSRSWISHDSWITRLQIKTLTFIKIELRILTKLVVGYHEKKTTNTKQHFKMYLLIIQN